MTILRSVTVLEPADNYDLISLDAVKAYFNTPIVTDDPNDPRLQMLISMQSKVIADYCDRVFAHETVSEVIFNTGGLVEDGATSISIPLQRWPIIALQSMNLNGTSISSGNYVVDPEFGVVRGALIGAELQVVYEAGYDLPEGAPGPLGLAVIDMVRQSYYYGSRDPMIQQIIDNTAGAIRFFPPPGISARAGGGSSGTSTQSALSPTATALVKPYRRPGMA